MKHRAFVFGILALSIALNAVFLYSYGKKEEGPAHKNFPLLSKRIFVEDANDVVLNFMPLRLALREYVQGNPNVGVYFEYLPSGISIGVNEKEEVPIASLSKVPIAMSIMKKIERNKLKKEDLVTLQKENLDRKFGTLWQRGEGTQLSIDELLNISLKESDNTANDTLFAQLTSNEVNEVYENLDIDVNMSDSVQKISPKSYSSIFRSLFLSSFLSEEHSSYILDILTKTNLSDKLPAGIPKDIPVSHKIGVFQRIDNKENVFTDCGIVYVPKRQYILCVFVETSSNEEATKHIAYISNMTYQYINIVKRER